MQIAAVSLVKKISELDGIEANSKLASEEIIGMKRGN